MHISSLFVVSNQPASVVTQSSHTTFTGQSPINKFVELTSIICLDHFALLLNFVVTDQHLTFRCC